MIELILMMGLSCPTPKVVNDSAEAWTSKDYKQMRISETRCGVLYPKSPCLVYFRKTPRKTYWVLCGKRRIKTNR